MPVNETQHRATSRTWPLVRFGLVALLSIVTALVLKLLPEWSIYWEGIRTVGVGAFFVSVLFLLSAWAGRYHSRGLLKSALFIWAFLLILEDIFNSTGGDTETALAGQFSVAVYGEVTVWILVFLVLLFLFLRNPHWIRSMFCGQYKWLSAFGLLCAASAIYSPRPMFSIAWSFVLWLVILVLRMCASLVRDAGDILSFVRATLWACCLLIVGQVYIAFAAPSAIFESGRLGQNETTLSVVAGLVIILSFTLRSVSIPVLSIVFSVVAAVVMLLAGGKAGILGSVLSVILYFLLKKKVGSALLSLAAIVVLGFVLLSVVAPLRAYVDSYAEEGQADTLTGRTDLWVAAIPVVRQSPILGHGYMASRFVKLQVEGVRWEASHLHNGFLEVLYNNGIVGLLFVLYMHAIIIKNLLRVIRQPGAPRELYEIAVGFLAIYANLLINSFFNATIGGRPGTLFMIFLALFVLGESLRKQLTQRSAPRAQPDQTGRPVWLPEHPNSVAQT
jgi:O-antigen ligase